MSVESQLKPLKNHVLGIPPQVQMMLRTMRPAKEMTKPLGLALELYERNLKFIEAIMSGRCPVEREEKAAQVAAHLILDTAFIHNAIAGTGYQIGDFPYNYLADRILPRETTDAADNT